MNDKTEQAVTDMLPCPFCGSTEGFYVVEGRTFRWRVISCRNCGEGTEVRHKNNSYEPDSYIADWNAAAPYPVMLRKEIDTLNADLDRAIVNFGDAAATVCDMRTQLAEAQKNEKRYLWMRDKETSEGWDIIGRSGTPDQIDAAIDAAKREKNGA